MTKSTLRRFSEVTESEMIGAIEVFLEKLNIPGSVVGSYDFYQAILGEYEKVNPKTELLKGDTVDIKVVYKDQTSPETNEIKPQDIVFN